MIRGGGGGLGGQRVPASGPGAPAWAEAHGPSREELLGIWGNSEGFPSKNPHAERRILRV